MSLHWYACISTNTYCFETHHISLETKYWALSNAYLIMQICSAIYEILADKAFTATDGLISQSFVVAFVHPTYLWIILIWGFPAQLSLWKLVYWLWRYKLNEVCDTLTNWQLSTNCLLLFWLSCLKKSTISLDFSKRKWTIKKKRCSEEIIYSSIYLY